MLVMPLRMTHVDTKVLVFLVQAMPASLHTARAIPLNRRTERQSPAKAAPECWSYCKRLRSDVRSRSVKGVPWNAPRVWFRGQGNITTYTRLLSNVSKWRFPLAIHGKPPSAPVASEGCVIRRHAEHPAAANGRDGEDWQPFSQRTDSPWKRISLHVDSAHTPGSSVSVRAHISAHTASPLRRGDPALRARLLPRDEGANLRSVARE